MRKKKRKHYRQTGTTDLIRDMGRSARSVGWRVSSSGNKYFENRKNRSDYSYAKKI